MTYAMKMQEERKEGIKEGVLTTVKNMLEDGLPVDRVARIAKIPEEQVLTIKTQIPSKKTQPIDLKRRSQHGFAFFAPSLQTIAMALHFLTS